VPKVPFIIILISILGEMIGGLANYIDINWHGSDRNNKRICLKLRLRNDARKEAKGNIFGHRDDFNIYLANDFTEIRTSKFKGSF
jgi:hypothetical protein